MLSYLFLLAAAAAPTELPTTELMSIEDPEITELIAILAQEIEAEATVAAELTTSEPKSEIASVTSPIIITNAIEPSMLEYKHWTGKYSPEQFAISVNGTKIETGKTCEIPANTTTVEIGYTYSFMNGMRTGEKKISYQLNENVTQVNITFDWKNDWRVVVSDGTAIKEITS